MRKKIQVPATLKLLLVRDKGRKLSLKVKAELILSEEDLFKIQKMLLKTELEQVSLKSE